jgi:2-dehydropantoate 2-reductase
VRFPLSDDPEELAESPLAVVFVKSYQTGKVAPCVARCLARDGIVLSLQNGLGNGEALVQVLGEERVALGITTCGAWRSAPGVVHWGGDGVTRMAPLRASRDLSRIAALFRAGGFAVELLRDPWRAVWEKVILNAAGNPVSALLRCSNGELFRNASALALMRRLLAEGVAVARAEGILFDEEELWASLLLVLERTGANRTSMLQDVERGTPTENWAISGAILRRGIARGVATPDTACVVALMDALDEAMQKKQKRQSSDGGSGGSEKDDSSSRKSETRRKQ